MFALRLPAQPLTLLCLGAHSDDIEIGAGATILSWARGGKILHVHWCVLSASEARANEARTSAAAFVAGAKSSCIELEAFKDGYFNYRGADLKDWFEGLKSRVNPDVILTHHGNDAHQDHRELSNLTWNSFRDHLILEYEIPKWDGDLVRPNVFSPVSTDLLDLKIRLLLRHFGTQRSKDWFDPEVFRGLARLRGMECRAVQGYAEAFFARKAVILPV
jgi:LmbE family N-acetylglucosaminyl deacetylase